MGGSYKLGRGAASEYGLGWLQSCPAVTGSALGGAWGRRAPSVPLARAGAAFLSTPRLGGVSGEVSELSLSGPAFDTISVRPGITALTSLLSSSLSSSSSSWLLLS